MLQDVHFLFTPLTPPPDISQLLPSFPVSHPATALRHRLPLNIGRPIPAPALAFDAHTAAAGLPPSADADSAFPYPRDLPSDDPDSASAPSGGDPRIYTDNSALEHDSDAATLATAVSGYPCSPPPSRHQSENAANRDKLSGASHITSQSPAASPTSTRQAATGISNRLNSTSINAQTLPDHYQATLNTSEQPRHLTQAQQQQQQQQQQQHQASSQLRTSQSSLHSPSDRFPPIASMLSSDRYPRMDRYAFPPAPHERRISDPSAHYSNAKQFSPPSSMTMGAGYGTPSYTLHRVGRSGSYSDVGVEPGLSQTAWHEDERDRLYVDDRSRTAFDPYSPIHSSFSSSTSSIATQALPSPHAASYYPSRGYSGQLGGTYYASPEDAPYDARPQTASSDSNSPSYGYSQVPVPSGSRSLPSTLPPHQADYVNFGGNDPSSKTYSFVSLPGNTVRKRPRRRYDEIERLYACNFPGCTKAYGTLNHLNAHVNMQKHGAKRHPNEFKEMRKQWRKMKKEQESERERMTHLEGGNLSDVMRRRRATDPSPYGIHTMNPGEDVDANGIPSGPVAASVNDPLGMSSLDAAAASSYGLGSSLSMNVGSDPMGGMGVGGGYAQHQQHYPSSSVYHSQQRPPISPTSPSGHTDTFGRFSSNGGGGLESGQLSESPTSYYPQSGGFSQGRVRTPPPRNQLPPDATLCAPFPRSHPSDVGDGYGLSGLSSSARGHHGAQ